MGLLGRWPARFLALGAAILIGACSSNTGDGATTGSSAPATQAPTTTAPGTTEATTTTTAPPGTPVGGEVTIGDDSEPVTLNPYALGGGSFTVAEIARAWTCGTQDLDGSTLELVPDVVEQLPTEANGGLVINADGTETVRYRIREEAIWEDGTPVSGYDYEFTYRTIVNEEYSINRMAYVDIIPDSIVAGDKTFEFTLSQSSLGVESLFGVILPKHQIESASADFMTGYDDTGWLSCGPFRIESWQKGDFVELVRNDNYWKTDPETGQQLPYLDRVVMRFFPDTATLIEAFGRREVDVMAPSSSENDVIEAILQLEEEGAVVEVVPGPIWEQLNFQFGENRLRRNPDSYNLHLNFRRAVAHAIDRERIVQELALGRVEPMGSYLDAFRPAWSGGAWEQYDYDPAAAREYLTALCSEPGVDCETVPPSVVFTTTLNSPFRVLLSELLMEMFEDVGIGYAAELEDSVLFFGETLELGSWDLGEWTWTGAPRLADLVWWHGVLAPGAPPTGMNYCRWGTPEVSNPDEPRFDQPAGYSDEHTARYAELWNLMNGSIDEAEILGYVQEAEALLADQVVILPLYQRPDVGAVWADVLAGYQHTPFQLGDPTMGGDTWNVEFWYRADS